MNAKMCSDLRLGVVSRSECGSNGVVSFGMLLLIISEGKGHGATLPARDFSVLKLVGHPRVQAPDVLFATQINLAG